MTHARADSFRRRYGGAECWGDRPLSQFQHSRTPQGWFTRSQLELWRIDVGVATAARFCYQLKSAFGCVRFPWLSR